jgi:peptidyl-prolyl cis-trans isomerase SurA
MLKTRNLVLVLVYTFLSCFQAIAQKGKVIDQVLGIVGNNVILQSAVENQYLQLLAKGYNASETMKCDIFEDQLFQKLLLNQAVLDSVEVSEKEIDQELTVRLEQFIAELGGVEKLEEYYRKPIGQIKSDFHDIIKDQLLSQRMQEEITGELKVTPSEVSRFFKEFPKENLPLLPGEVEYFQIVKKPTPTKVEKDEVKVKLEEFRQRVLKGENFASLATLYSEDPGSFKDGGSLGFVNRNQLVPEFSAAAFVLKNGELSKIVETMYGYHLIQMVEKKGDLAHVRHILMKPKITMAEKLKAKSKIDSIYKRLRTDTIKFEKMAQMASDDEDTRKNGGLAINPQSRSSKFEAKSLDAETSVAIEGLKPGQMSEPFEAKDNNANPIYKIVMLKTRSVAHVANLKDDYQIIQEKALEDKRMKKVDEWTREKIKTSYIRIDETYKGCSFKYQWLEKP